MASSMDGPLLEPGQDIVKLTSMIAGATARSPIVGFATRNMAAQSLSKQSVLASLISNSKK